MITDNKKYDIKREYKYKYIKINGFSKIYKKTKRR